MWLAGLNSWFRRRGSVEQPVQQVRHGHDQAGCPQATEEADEDAAAADDQRRPAGGGGRGCGPDRARPRRPSVRNTSSAAARAEEEAVQARHRRRPGCRPGPASPCRDRQPELHRGHGRDRPSQPHDGHGVVQVPEGAQGIVEVVLGDGDGVGQLLRPGRVRWELAPRSASRCRARATRGRWEPRAGRGPVPRTSSVEPPPMSTTSSCADRRRPRGRRRGRWPRPPSRRRSSAVPRPRRSAPPGHGRGRPRPW